MNPKGRYHITVKKRDGSFETEYYPTEQAFGDALADQYYPFLGDGYRIIKQSTTGALFEEWSYLDMEAEE